METYVFPRIGDLPVDEVSSGDVLEVLRPIWLEKEETARRVLQRIAAVVSYAVACEHREHEFAVGGLRAALPRQRHLVRHHPACAVADAPALYRAIRDEAGGMSGKALQFVMLTAARSGEVHGARWSEIDMAAKLWIIPADRMKANKEHLVARCSEALDILAALQRKAGHQGLVFPNLSGNPLSDTAVLRNLMRFAPGCTVHGLRSTFKDWSTEETEYPDDVSEAALAHVDSNKVRAAYKRSNLLNRRRELMEDWAEFLGCGAEPANTVARSDH